MKFTPVVVAALAALADALEFGNSAYDVKAGEAFTLTWSGASGPVTITLKTGASTALQTVEIIDSADSGTTFSWLPPASLASGTYAFEISDTSGATNYSPQFQFSGSASGTLGLTTAASTSGAASTSAAVSSSKAATTSGATETSSASESSSTTGFSNSTMTTGSTQSTTSSSTTARTSSPTNSNDGQRLASPLALILGTIAALVYFN